MANDYSQVEGSADPIRGQITQNADGSLNKPKNIVSSIASARNLYLLFRQQHLRRIQLYAEIEGLIAGNPPYNPADLEKHGLSHVSNFNNLDGRSLYERSALAFWNLLNAAQTICKFEIRGKLASESSVEYADILARNWDFVIREWPSFLTLVNTLTGQLIKLGISPVIWPDERDWRWKTIELSRFFVSDQTSTDIAQLTSVCVETTFTVQYLFEAYEKFKDKKDDKKNPWVIKELENFLLYRANQWAKYNSGSGWGEGFTDLMDLQRRVQNRDFLTNTIFSDDVRIVSLLQKEYDGKISHYMFDRFMDSGAATLPSGFLYFVDRQYNSMEEALVMFTGSPGEFTIHSNRGLGHKIFSGAQALMQLDCAIVDMSKMSATPLIQSLGTGSKDAEAIKFFPGVATHIGSAEFVQNNLGANIAQLVNASSYILQKLQFNTANSGDDPGVPDRHQGSISAPEAKMRAYKEFSVLKQNVAHFYSQFDIVIKNMVIKMLHSKEGDPGHDTAKEWKERCIEDGVPPEIFELRGADRDKMPRHLKVKATRVAGDGSTLASLMGLEALAPMVASFGPKGVREYQREMIIATRGPDYVDAYLSDADDPDERAGGASLAALENAAMQQGFSPVFSPDNAQRAHMVTHMALANNLIRQLQQQQMSPVDADKVFTVLVPHGGEHFQFMARNPFEVNFVKGVEKAWGQIVQYATLNRKNATEMMKAEIKKKQELAEKQNEAMSDTQRKDAVAAADIERKNRDMAAKNERADEANETRGDLMRTKVEKDADNARLKIQLESRAKQSATDLEAKPLEEIRADLDTINGATPAPNDIEMV